MAADAATGHTVASSTEDTGGFAFFRKHQKAILYTAVLFALVTFSIPVALQSFFTPSADFKGPTMKIGDRTIQVTHEDYIVGGMMMRAQGDPALVLPNLATSTDNEDLRDRFTALRRLAIEFGIEVSDEEVDRAIAQAVKVLPTVDSATQLAVQMLGYDSLQGYRVVIKEALRIGTFLRLQVAGVDTFDSALAAKLLEDSEKVVLTVAAFDKKAVEEALKEEGVADDELEKWVADLPEEERRPFEDPNRASLSAVGIVYEDFDREPFAVEIEGVEFDEARLRTEYEQRKARLFKIEKPKDDDGENEKEEAAAEEAGKSGEEETGPPKNGKDDDGAEDGGCDDQDPPAAGAEAETKTEQGGAEGETEQGEVKTPAQVPSSEQPTQETAEPTAGANPQEGEGVTPPPQDEFIPFEEVKDRLETMLLAEAVLDKMRFGKIEEALADHMLTAIETRNAAVVAASEARKVLAAAEEKLEEDPENDEKKETVETAEAAVELAEEAEKDAAEALDAQRKTFDFAAQMTALIGERPGFATYTEADPVPSADLNELGPLGKWENSTIVQTMDAAGELSTQLQRTDKACFHFQVPEILERPLKPFEEIADKARAEYFVAKADEVAKADAEKLEETLLVLAKEKIADEVAEIEKKSAEDAEKKFSTWKEEREAELETAKATLDDYRDRPKSQIFKAWNDQVTKLEETLGKQDDKRKEIEEAAAEELETEIEKAARKVYKDVLEAAVKETKFEVETLQAYPADLSSRPRFQHRYSERVRFLFSDGTVRDLEEGEVTDLLDDATGRALYLVACTSREKMVMSDLTRRDLNQARPGFVREQLTECLEQSFSLDALEKRWGYESPTPREEEEEPRQEQN